MAASARANQFVNAAPNGASPSPAWPMTPPTADGDILDDEKWRHGDAVLISSDNVRFRVPSFYLLAASSVLRDGHELALPGPIELHLTDHVIESARILRYFLQLVTTNTVDISIIDVSNVICDGDPTDMCVGPRLVNFIRLLRKFGCDGHLDRLADWVKNDARNRNENTAQLSAFSIFLAGAELQRRDLCSMALERKNAVYDDDDAPVDDAVKNPNSSLDSYHVLNPSGMPLDMYDEIPSDYRFALTRAWIGRDPGANVSDAFLKALSSVQQFRKRSRATDTHED